ncbi:hypothetical protein T439DRAFT_392 [Meredithblackwellia eburnea MCA 4105]
MERHARYLSYPQGSPIKYRDDIIYRSLASIVRPVATPLTMTTSADSTSTLTVLQPQLAGLWLEGIMGVLEKYGPASGIVGVMAGYIQRDLLSKELKDNYEEAVIFFGQ